MRIAARHGDDASLALHKRGTLICLTGIDGSGKSTQAAKLVAQARAAGYPARYVWGGRTSSLTKPLVRLGKAWMHAPARPVTASIEVNSSYRSYMHTIQRMFTRRATRSAWQHVTLAEHIVQIWMRVTVPLARGEMLVCDRYLYDTLVGQAVLFGMTPTQFAAHSHAAVLRLVPRPAVGFWLDAPPNVALSRKADIYDRSHLEARQPLYAQLAHDCALRTLDATRDADWLAHHIWLEVQTLL